MDNNIPMCLPPSMVQISTKMMGSISGQSYDYCKKVEVAIAYKSSEEANGGRRPRREWREEATNPCLLKQGVQSFLEICQQNRERTGETWESAQSVGSDEIKGDVSVK